MNIKQRNTTAKTTIQDLLAASKVALSQAEIQTMLQGLCDRVTTYRVLERLLAEGIVHKIVDVDGVMKYAFCNACSSSAHRHDHVHFSCERCKSLTCVEQVELTFHLPNNYQIKEMNFVLSGICPNCV